MDNKIQIFEDKKIRTAWDEEKEEWYFSVSDGVQKGAEYAILTDEITRAWSGMTTRKYKIDKRKSA